MMARSLPRRPPRLGLFLLDRLSDRNEGLAGDLIEEFHVSQSAWRFWRQLVVAIVTGGFRRPIEIRPIRLVDAPTWQEPREDFSAKRQRVQTSGLGASPVAGIGGIGIVAIIFLIAYVQPAYLILLGCAVVLGIAIGVVRALRSRGLMRAIRGAENPPLGSTVDDRRVVPRA